MHNTTRLVTLGVITGAHGVRGVVKVRSYTQVPEDIARYGALQDMHGARHFHLRITGRLKDLLLCAAEGVTDRTAAEALRGMELCVPRDRLPAMDADAGRYLIDDLIGLPVALEDGSHYGTVRALHNYGAGDILEIAPAAGGETELALFCEENFPLITQDAVTFRPPEVLAVRPQATTTPET